MPLFVGAKRFVMNAIIMSGDKPANFLTNGTSSTTQIAQNTTQGDTFTQQGTQPNPFDVT